MYHVVELLKFCAPLGENKEVIVVVNNDKLHQFIKHTNSESKAISQLLVLNKLGASSEEASCQLVHFLPPLSLHLVIFEQTSSGYRLWMLARNMFQLLVFLAQSRRYFNSQHLASVSVIWRAIKKKPLLPAASMNFLPHCFQASMSCNHLLPLRYHRLLGLRGKIVLMTHEKQHGRNGISRPFFPPPTRRHSHL